MFTGSKLRLAFTGEVILNVITGRHECKKALLRIIKFKPNFTAPRNLGARMHYCLFTGIVVLPEKQKGRCLFCDCATWLLRGQPANRTIAVTRFKLL